MSSDIIGRAPKDIYDKSGKLLLAKGREITPKALKRIEKAKVSLELFDTDNKENIGATKNITTGNPKEELPSYTEIPALDVSELMTKIPHVDQAVISYPMESLEESGEKVKDDELFLINLNMFGKQL